MTAREEKDEDLETCSTEMQVYTTFCSDIWTKTAEQEKGDKIQVDGKKKKVDAYSSKRRRRADEEELFLKLASSS